MSLEESTVSDQMPDHYRALLQQEQRRVAHLSLINEVQRCILSTSDKGVFLPAVAAEMLRYFPTCDLAIYICDPLPSTESAEPARDARLQMAVHVGNRGLILGSLNQDSEQSSFAMRCAAEARMLCYGFSEEFGLQCEPAADDNRLAIPIAQNERSMGVLELASNDPEALDAGDVVLLQMITTLLAARIESCVMNDEMRELGAFQQNLFSTMLHSLLVVDENIRVQSVNERLCQTLGVPASELEGALLEDILGKDVLLQSGLAEAVQDVTENGVPHELEGVQLPLPGLHLPEGPLIFDIRIFRVFFRGQPQAVLLLINLTSRWRNFHQLQLMSEIGRSFGASLDVNKVLRTVLTCVTAGSALGFNRAFLLLMNEKQNRLTGTMALGPSTAAEAYEIWQELSYRDWNLQEILEIAENASNEADISPLQEQIRELTIDLNNPLLPALQTSLDQQGAILATQQDLLGTLPKDTPEAHRRQWERAAALFNAPETVVVPLLAKGRLVGVVLADNVFSGNLIEDTDVQLLDNLARQAALTIDNARTYEQLIKAQRELVNSERLAVVGDMTARLSHEIRNPLTTIGGFARRMHKFPANTEAVQRNAGIILGEIERLEELLEDLLEMARVDKLDIKPCDLHEVIDKALLLAGADIKALGVRVKTEYDSSIPTIPFDPSRILQVLLNIVRNGAQSMPDGGELHLATSLHSEENTGKVEIAITDQGQGISENALRHVFDPFYSTKLKGSGLGLAISWRIIKDHGGKIEVESTPGTGTTFKIFLPLSAT